MCDWLSHHSLLQGASTYAIKTIWFREQIVVRGIRLFKIDTVEQLGDMFTKGLPRPTFEYLRHKLLGW
eukprot:CCRYP_006343-RA/>CCRYP_006343-RA protein AED:0.03 eAED:-0.02 QI:0/-1/0/1/-1/1/1/0/67